jgi:hypothetical protein
LKKAYQPQPTAMKPTATPRAYYAEGYIGQRTAWPVVDAESDRDAKKGNHKAQEKEA